MNPKSEELPPSHSRPQSHTKPHKMSNLILSSSSSNLRDTLSSFGDDLVRIKDSNFLYFEGNDNPNVPAQQTQIQFERVPASEVGVKSSRWRKAIVAGLFTSSSSPSNSKHKIADLSLQRSATQYYENGKEVATESKTPPFWGVGYQIRGKVSMLSLQLILHEMACFASCVLLGCLIAKLTKVNYWNIDDSQWLLNRCYESTVIFLMGLTVVGFLTRIDTTDPDSLLTSPFHLIPVLLMVVPIYLVKAWDLQREECLQYLKLGDELKKYVHIMQYCDYYNHQHKINGMISNDHWNVTVIIMSLTNVVVCVVISIYLFLFRNKFCLIERFGSGKLQNRR